MINIKQDSMMIICCRHILTCTADSTTEGVGVKCSVDRSFDVGLDFKSIAEKQSKHSERYSFT